MQAPRKKFKPGYPKEKPGNESNLKKVEYYTKILASIISAVGITVAVTQLYIGFNQYRENLERDFRKSYYTEQVKVYDDLLNRAATIACYTGEVDDSIMTVRCNEFEVFYYSKLDLFQDDSVSKHSFKFRHALNRYRTGRCKKPELKKTLDELALSCRRSIQSTWRVNIENLIRR